MIGVALLSRGAVTLVPMKDPIRGRIWQVTTFTSGELIAASVLRFSTVILGLFAVNRRKAR
jgi:hypothetical protein